MAGKRSSSRRSRKYKKGSACEGLVKRKRKKCSKRLGKLVDAKKPGPRKSHRKRKSSHRSKRAQAKAQPRLLNGRFCRKRKGTSCRKRS